MGTESFFGEKKPGSSDEIIKIKKRKKYTVSVK